MWQVKFFLGFVQNDKKYKDQHFLSNFVNFLLNNLFKKNRTPKIISNLFLKQKIRNSKQTFNMKLNKLLEDN